MTKYKLINNQDGNNQILLNSDTTETALYEAIEQLGWGLVSYQDNENSDDSIFQLKPV